MLAWILLELAPLLYGAAYLFHSFRLRRFRQAATVSVLLLCLLAAFGILLWEFLAVP